MAAAASAGGSGGAAAPAAGQLLQLNGNLECTCFVFLLAKSMVKIWIAVSVCLCRSGTSPPQTPPQSLTSRVYSKMVFK